MKYRAFFVAVFLLLTPTVLHAAPSDGMMEALVKCANTSDDAVRHACFDRLVPQLKTMQAANPPAQAAATEGGGSWFDFDLGDIFSSPPRGQTTPQQFGSESIPASAAISGSADSARPADINSITAAVTQYWIDSQGYFVVRLDNGQVWGQLDGDDSFAHFNKSENNTVVISRGILRSYNLQLDGYGQIYKVRRIK